MNLRHRAANMNDDGTGYALIEEQPLPVSARSPRLLEWLTRLTQPGFSLEILHQPYDLHEKISAAPMGELPHMDDWHAITHICGYYPQDFVSAAAAMPLSAAEIEYFRRNHRGTENHISRDFLTAQTDLPSPLAELYGLYRYRGRIDAEAALFLAQSSGSMRVARVMSDLLAIGAFSNGMEYISYLGVNYSVPAAFDTSIEIDHANIEAARRLALPADHPSHLLTMTPDEVGVLATSIVEKNALQPADFLEKANLLCEARQDVNRLPPSQQFTTAVIEKDLHMNDRWTERLMAAFNRIFPQWVASLPENQQ
jgi:hypothetical protein